MLVGATISFEVGTIMLHYDDKRDILVKPDTLGKMFLPAARDSINKDDIIESTNLEIENLSADIHQSAILPADEKAKRISALGTPEARKKIELRVVEREAKKIADAKGLDSFKKFIDDLRAALSSIEIKLPA